MDLYLIHLIKTINYTFVSVRKSMYLVIYLPVMLDYLLNIIRKEPPLESLSGVDLSDKHYGRYNPSK